MGLPRHAAWAPTRTPRWSTGSACSAGASAASRPRRRCWASRSRCCMPQVVGVRAAGALPGHHGHRPRPDRHRDAARARRRRQVRRVLRPGRAPDAARGPGHDRQHVPGVRLHVRHLPDRRRDAALPALHRPQPSSVDAGGGGTPRSRGCGTSRTDRAALHRALELDLSTSCLAWPARAARRTACRSTDARRRSATRWSADAGRRIATTAQERPVVGDARLGRIVPGQRRSGHRRRAAGVPAPLDAQWRPNSPTADAAARVVPRRAEHEIDHGAVAIAAITLVHQHLEPVGDGRRRAARPQRGRSAAYAQAVGQDQPRPGSRVVTEYFDGPGSPVPGAARLPPRRLRLHDLHRQLRAAAPEVTAAIDRAGPAVAAVLSGNRNFDGADQPDVAMNYLASPAAGGGLRPRRARWTSTCSAIRSAPTATGEPVFLRDIWPGRRGGPAGRRAQPRRRDVHRR